jgi:hypothetical protein
MLKPRLVVDVLARIEWSAPPATMQEEALRATANTEAQRAAAALEPAVQLLVATLLQERQA